MNPNMDTQPKYTAQQLSLTPPQGTLPWGRGPFKKDAFTLPDDVSMSFLKRGQERFDIYCAVCHDRAGTGKGMVVARGFVPPPPLTDPRVVSYTDSELFDIISNGIRNMPGYKHQITEEDRTAIVLYVRALQK